MSKDLEARLRRLEQKQSKPDYTRLKPIIPLAGMSKSWIEQYHKDPEVISIIWQDVIKEYHEQHIRDFEQHPEHYTDELAKLSNNKTISLAIPPWYRLIPSDKSEWYKTCVHNAETRLTFWQTVGGGRKETLKTSEDIEP